MECFSYELLASWEAIIILISIDFFNPDFYQSDKKEINVG